VLSRKLTEQRLINILGENGRFKIELADKLAIVALNIAASMTPIKPCGNKVKLATA